MERRAARGNPGARPRRAARGLRDPLRHRLVLLVGRVRRGRRRPVQRPPVDADVRRRRRGAAPSGLRASRRRLELARRGVPVPRSAPRRADPVARPRRRARSRRGGRAPPSFGFPLAWCFAEGKGRVFSTSLGHFPSAWESPSYLRHLSGGLGWALGETGVSRTRNFSNWAYWRLQLERVAAAEQPAPTDDDAWRARTRAELDARLGPHPAAGAARPRDDRRDRLRRLHAGADRLRRRGHDVGSRVPPRSARPSRRRSRSRGPRDPWSRLGQVAGVRARRRRAGRRLRARARVARLRRARARPARLRRTPRLDARRQVPLRLGSRVRNDGRRRPARAQPLGPRSRARRARRAPARRPGPDRGRGTLVRRDLHAFPHRARRTGAGSRSCRGTCRRGGPRTRCRGTCAARR